MAGAGYKLFNTGDVLTAAQVNTYLQEQAVMRFASAAARTTALSGVLAEGMVSYLMDTDQLEVYDGTNWVSASGDITGVTAGTGISGGGTSGAVTITNSMATTIDAKGDLIVGTANDAFARLAVGSNNQVLTADSTTATGLKWAAAAGGGKVLQVVQGTASANVSNSTDVYADTGLTATITPSATSSKILVFYSLNAIRKSDGNAGNRMQIRLLRGASLVQDAIDLLWTNTTQFQTQSYSNTYLDSPNTTSATTYKVQFMNVANVASVSVQPSGGSSPSTITLLEIGA